ncbi:hypothetical protein LX36DRAFT_438532 [Colletotrichum falcatum]|nr:hypothetical protein LX36DRAFT_438532 [Colletotrichum falcatum]
MREKRAFISADGFTTNCSFITSCLVVYAGSLEAGSLTDPSAYSVTGFSMYSLTSYFLSNLDQACWSYFVQISARMKILQNFAFGYSGERCRTLSTQEK